MCLLIIYTVDIKNTTYPGIKKIMEEFQGEYDTFITPNSFYKPYRASDAATKPRGNYGETYTPPTWQTFARNPVLRPKEVNPCTLTTCTDSWINSTATPARAPYLAGEPTGKPCTPFWTGSYPPLTCREFFEMACIFYNRI